MGMAQAQKEIQIPDFPLLQQQAENGDAAAQMELATCFRQGRGIRRNMEQAVHWLQKAAEQEVPEALYQLGRCAEDGNGMQQDDRTAVSYYHAAAQAGYAEAQYAYGICLLGGIGCAVDCDEAEKWMELSARQGNPHAQRELEQLRAEKNREDTDVAKPQATQQPAQQHQKETFTFTPVDPVPYQLQKKVAEEEQSVLQPQEMEIPILIKRSPVVFIITFIVCGILCGILMKPIYQRMPNIGEATDSAAFPVLMGIIGGLIGAGVSLALSGLYKTMQEAFPLFGVLLLLPLLVFILAGIFVTIFTVIWTVIVAVVKAILAIVGVALGLWVLGNMFGG